MDSLLRLVLSATVLLASTICLSAADPPDEQQTLVLQMVDQHLPQLKSVLDYLREKEPRKYERAMRDLSRQMRRLEASRKRGEHFFDNELQHLKIQTEIDLTAAKLRLRDEPQLREKLRRMVRQRHQLRIERLMFEREALAQRLAKNQEQLTAVEQRLKRAQQSLDADVDKSVESLLRNNKPSADARPTPENRNKRSPQS